MESAASKSTEKHLPTDTEVRLVTKAFQEASGKKWKWVREEKGRGALCRDGRTAVWPS